MELAPRPLIQPCGCSAPLVPWPVFAAPLPFPNDPGVPGLLLGTHGPRQCLQPRLRSGLQEACQEQCAGSLWERLREGPWALRGRGLLHRGVCSSSAFPRRCPRRSRSLPPSPPADAAFSFLLWACCEAEGEQWRDLFGALPRMPSGSGIRILEQLRLGKSSRENKPQIPAPMGKGLCSRRQRQGPWQGLGRARPLPVAGLRRGLPGPGGGCVASAEDVAPKL